MSYKMSQGDMPFAAGFDPAILIGEVAMGKMIAYCEMALPCEIQGYGTVQVRDQGENKTIYVDDVFILEQDVNGGLTTTTKKTVDAFLREWVKSGSTSVPKVWWHSHCTGSTFWSGIDENTINLYGVDWVISMVMARKVDNHNWRVATRIDVYEPFRFVVNGLPVHTEVPLLTELPDVKEDFERKVTKPKTVWNGRNFRSESEGQKLRGNHGGPVRIDAPVLGGYHEWLRKRGLVDDEIRETTSIQLPLEEPKKNGNGRGHVSLRQVGIDFGYVGRECDMHPCPDWHDHKIRSISGPGCISRFINKDCRHPGDNCQEIVKSLMKKYIENPRPRPAKAMETEITLKELGINPNAENYSLDQKLCAQIEENVSGPQCILRAANGKCNPGEECKRRVRALVARYQNVMPLVRTEPEIEESWPTIDEIVEQESKEDENGRQHGDEIRPSAGAVDPGEDEDTHHRDRRWWNRFRVLSDRR